MCRYELLNSRLLIDSSCWWAFGEHICFIGDDFVLNQQPPVFDEIYFIAVHRLGAMENRQK